MSSVAQAPRTDTSGNSTVSWVAKPWVTPALIAGIVVLVFAGTARFGFVYDDGWQIVENTWITSASHVPRFFTSHVWAFAGMAGSYWRPLFLLWLLVLRSIFGLDPVGWHLASVALHALATVLVYALVHRLTASRAAAVITALVFGLHPVVIESVAWISGVTDPLLSVFFVAAMLAYLKWRDHRSRLSLVWSLAFYALALMAKEPAVVLPVLIFWYAWLNAGGRNFGARSHEAFRAVLPYIPLTLIYAVVHVAVLERVTYPHSLATPLNTLLTWPSLLLFYARLLVWPVPVSPQYGLRIVTSAGLGNFILPALLLLAIVAALVIWARRDRMIAFASVWLALPLLPALYLAPQGSFDFAHGRYLYLPCIGFALMVAAALRKLPTGASRIFGAPAVPTIAAAVIVLALAAGTSAQQVYWASDLLLFTRGVAVAPENPVALAGLGVQYGKRSQYDKAIALLQRAEQIDPYDWHPKFSLGYTYFVLGRYPEAEPLLARAMELNASNAHPDQFVYLGLTEMKLGNWTKAEAAIRQAVQRRPNVERYRYALALLLEQQNRWPEAAAEFEATLQLNPANADARARLDRIRRGSSPPLQH